MMHTYYELIDDFVFQVFMGLFEMYENRTYYDAKPNTKPELY